MKGTINDAQFWSKNMHTPKINTWRGLTFERICMTHIDQIKHALHIDSISTTFYSWRSAHQTNRNAQIDIVIERADNMTNICEAKYSEIPYSISKDEYNKYLNRMAAFKQETHNRGGIIPTYITSGGLVQNNYSDNLGLKDLSINDLF